MPYAPKHPCRHPGCSKLAVGQYCKEHQRQATYRYNHYEREPKTNKRYGRAWKQIRERYITVHPLCEMCEKEGRLKPAELVHHVLPIADGGSNNDSNLMSLCESCHSSIHLKMRHDQGEGKSLNVISRTAARPRV